MNSGNQRTSRERQGAAADRVNRRQPYLSVDQGVQAKEVNEAPQQPPTNAIEKRGERLHNLLARDVPPGRDSNTEVAMHTRHTEQINDTQCHTGNAKRKSSRPRRDNFGNDKGRRETSGNTHCTTDGKHVATNVGPDRAEPSDHLPDS
jgi:hypothetical protein